MEPKTTLPELRGKMNEKGLAKAQANEEEQAFFARLQKFMSIANGEVEADKLQEHPIVKDCKYLPISFMEMALDELFFGLWNTGDFKWQIVTNEIVASIQLSVFHPVSKIWITRTGAAAIQIMVDSIPETESKKMSRQEKNAWAVDVNNKKPGALTNGGFAKLKAECFKNACVGLGKYFGRDVNREHSAEDYLGTIKDPSERKAELRKVISDILAQNQDHEEVTKITQHILDTEDRGENTIEYYTNVIKTLRPNVNNNQ